MKEKDKDILMAKVETLRWSFSDTQLQAIMSVMHDLILSISTVDDKELGFKGKAVKK